MREIKKYIAFDETEFDNEHDCAKYEGDLLIKESLTKILYDDFISLHTHDTLLFECIIYIISKNRDKLKQLFNNYSVYYDPLSNEITDYE